MMRRAPRATRTGTRFPYATRCRSPGGGAYRRRNARLENQAAERAHPLGRRTFILSAGPGVEGDQIDLRVQAILLDQSDQLARILVAVILVFQHPIFEGDRTSTRLNSSH